jgi:kinetochore protein Spc7/SPC105
VSFAPEATLHTWNVVELIEDSTSSSAANSTRRASSLANSANQTPAEGPEADEEEDPDAAFSPIQPGLHQQPSELSSSPFSGSSVGGSDGTQSPVKDVDNADSDSEDFDAESTAMSLDDITARTSGTAPTDDNTSSSERLNEALRQAAREAGTSGVGIEEDNDVSMEIADQEITGAFKPWIQKGQRISFDMEDMSALHDQENINPHQQSNSYDHTNASDDAEDDYNENEDLSMEITSAVGHILNNSQNSRNYRKSISEQTNYDEQTMELTKVVGGIELQQSPAKSDVGSNMEENEEMTMEFTSVVGGVLSKHVHNIGRASDGIVAEAQGREDTSRDFSEWGSDDGDDDAGMDMEFTGAVGGILSPIMEERTGSQDGHTAGMDITAAVGRILAPGLATSDKAQAKQIMELESDSGQLASSPFQVQVPVSPPKPLPSHHIASIASETGSPSLASVRSRRTRRSSASPGIHLSPSRQVTPNKNKPRTPLKQATPQPSRPITPGKTPPSSNISFRSASPKKLFRQEIKASASKSQSPGRRSLFEASANGDSTPAFILRPHPRQSSGLGVDKEGLGSPKVAEILDRRRSIGEDAQEFVPQESSPRRIRFEDPIRIHEEVDREREEEEQREERNSSALQVSDLDPTSNLRDLISSLTPKKRKIRKSLHVGAARGLLGKRPVELDDDEEDESPKRIRAANASPVKPVKLPAPPSKDETVRRVIRGSMGKSFDLSPVKQGSFTPRGQPPTRIESPLKLKSPAQTYGRDDEPTQEQMGGEPVIDEAHDSAEEDSEWEPIELQDFLNLTNIHFMELTTTKRRHTTVAGNERTAEVAGSRDLEKRSVSLEDCVAAGFCTVPMLELYQHVSIFQSDSAMNYPLTLHYLVLPRIEILYLRRASDHSLY